MPAPRFRFGPFVVSPAQRVLRRSGTDLPLIPRYFDLLVLLLTHRHRAVARQEIFDLVWKDVIVSDGALSQAIRTIRRALGDDSREPRFIRTVARHGYQFVWRDIVEESDDVPIQDGEKTAGADRDRIEHPDAYDALLDRLLRTDEGASATDEDRRDAAEQLHALGTREALTRLDERAGHPEARAMLRDARWDVAEAGDVPLLGMPGAARATLALVTLRLRRAARTTSSRWASASVGGALAGAVAGIIGGIALCLVPDSPATPAVIVALALVGAAAGGLGAAGVGVGLAAAEALARSQRALALALCGAAGGALAGVVAQSIVRAILSGLFGRDLLALGGVLEGVLLGAAAGAGYAISTSPLPGGGMAAPRGRARLRAALITAVACSLAAIVLTISGRHLVASSLDLMAGIFDGSTVGLAPLAGLLGEQELRPMTRMVVSAFEGLLFGAGVAFGLTHRPRP